MRPFETKTLSATPDAAAPDRAAARLRLALPRGSFGHSELPAGAVSHTATHRGVEEIWYILLRRGRIWRRSREEESVVDAAPSLCLTIPL
jgi:mannose-6-phosphate isomerase-like protein (cupin superfamily)